MRTFISVVLVASILGGPVGCVHVGCEQVPLPLAIPLYAVAVPILLVRGDLSHKKGRTFDVTDLVGADLAKTKALAKEITDSIHEPSGTLESGPGTLRWNEPAKNADADLEGWLVARRASLRH